MYINTDVEQTSWTWITLSWCTIAEIPSAKIVAWLRRYDLGNHSAIRTLYKESISNLQKICIVYSQQKNDYFLFWPKGSYLHTYKYKMNTNNNLR